ncbi:hypothetical protein PVK06_027239 [Gossypium arboreum]|uniref:Uncharacterized protein n=1 Tax=Gossypium arboreum TaxID=29729 RepID=A0ABR0NZT2_GOSAR|nr:hypothetical protein PVK06_027239 [Gossypium arboreum]
MPLAHSCFPYKADVVTSKAVCYGSRIASKVCRDIPWLCHDTNDSTEILVLCSLCYDIRLPVLQHNDQP